MEYLVKEGSPEGKKLLLLHGTGGDEHSLVEVAEFFDEASTILALRGEIQEDGMNRFFKRNGLNQFDVPNLEEQTDRLLHTIKARSQVLGIPLAEWVIVGYSNGANIAAHLLLERETELRRGILLHPMSLGVHSQHFSLADKQLWLSYGDDDPIVSEAAFTELQAAFQQRQAAVAVEKFAKGHQVTLAELTAARDWLTAIK